MTPSCFEDTIEWFIHCVFKVLDELKNIDTETQNIIDWVNELPIMTEEDVKEQILRQDKSMIEDNGFNQ